MGNKKTPLLQKLRNVGGTMYVFPSASEDIGLNLQSTTSGVAMSHFALLNIPNISKSKCCEKSIHDIKVNDGNEALALSLQNYAMNFETHLTNREDYNYQKLETVSEKVFWKWAKHVGILGELNNITKIGNSSIYMENTENPVIKCFGAIDAGNQLSTEFGMFNETYINVPTSWGAGPVYLQMTDSDNYKLGTEYNIDPNYLEGRHVDSSYYSYMGNQDYPFFDKIIDNHDYQYVIDKDNDGYSILKNISQIQTATRKAFNNNSIIFDSYDDINIDILGQLNIKAEFEFNAILLYYSIYDQDDLVKTPYAINLFGVIFLDGTQPNGNDEFFIQPILKRKSTTTQFGNSYSFRVNLKTMSVYDNTDALIQDNTTISGISSVEFGDAISNMNRAIDIMNSNLTTTMKIQDQYAAIIQYYDSFQEQIDDISTCLNAYIKGTRSSFIDTSILYVNEIRTSETANSTNRIIVRSHKATKDASGNILYNEPVIDINNTDVAIPTLHNSSLWTKQSYVIVEPTNTDRSMQDVDSTLHGLYYNECNDTLQRAFDSSANLIIKLKHESSDYNRNVLYIDPTSEIFNKNNNANLNWLLDTSSNVNYTAFIPYLILEIQRLNEKINNLSTNL